ncbi:MAG: nuclear transport factor 2 family protein [Candidatus Chryseobacterium colombiense]|nr:nuclear transport factor 2 family protein [Chryseobacterium sp.]WEK71418.1 MAG: nuclear transport factor 2 family protein [Chryseobacterium sp.]
MNLPKVVSELVRTQNNFDSAAYANCFSETAIVFDEGKTHNGRKEIENWIADANERYKSTMQPLSYEENGRESILEAEVLGTFPGSPLVLKFHFEIADDQIQNLKVTE